MCRVEVLYERTEIFFRMCPHDEYIIYIPPLNVKTVKHLSLPDVQRPASDPGVPGRSAGGELPANHGSAGRGLLRWRLGVLLSGVRRLVFLHDVPPLL